MNPIQAFFAALLTFFLATAVRRTLGVVLIGTTLVTAPVSAQEGIAVIIAAAGRVVDFIVRTLGPLLSSILGSANAILGAINAFRAFWEQVIDPILSIVRAQALAANIAAMLRGLFSSLLRTAVNSATLPRPITLETIARNRSTTDFGGLDAAFHGVYQPLPLPAKLNPIDRDLIDMSDASAKAMLKTLKESEQVADRTADAAQGIATEAQGQAPGSAAYLSGNGVVAAVHSQAMMLRMIAAEIRQEAAKLAHDNARRKRNATFSEEFRRTGAGVFRR